MEKIFPPNGWKCRCRVVPLMKHEVEGIDINAMRAIVDEYLGTGEWKMNEAQGWDSNRGETAEVFPRTSIISESSPIRPPPCWVTCIIMTMDWIPLERKRLQQPKKHRCSPGIRTSGGIRIR